MVRAHQLITRFHLEWSNPELVQSIERLNEVLIESLNITDPYDQKELERFAAEITFPKLPDGPTVSVPGGVMQLIAEVVYHLASGNAVAIVAIPPYITVGEAAELLGTSQAETLRLIRQGQLELKEVEPGSEYVTLNSVLQYAQHESDQVSGRLIEALRKSEKAQAVGQ